MGTFRNVEEAKLFFKDDRFAMESGVELLEIDEQHALAKMDITANHLNALGRVMGGAIYTLADLAISALGYNLYEPVVGLENTIHYLSASKGSTLFAKASCIKNGRTTIVLEAKITDDLGTLIATMVGTAFKINKK